MYEAVLGMSDEDLIGHLESEHAEAMAFRWPTEGPHRSLACRRTFEVYHDYFLHTLPREASHEHRTGWEVREKLTRSRWEQRTPCICLHPPTHQPDCTGKLGLVLIDDRPVGPSAQEKLWAELDRLMDGLKATPEYDLKYAAVPKAEARAFALALALMINPSNPDTATIRHIAVRRWKERQNAK